MERIHTEKSIVVTTDVPIGVIRRGLQFPDYAIIFSSSSDMGNCKYTIQYSQLSIRTDRLIIFTTTLKTLQKFTF